MRHNAQGRGPDVDNEIQTETENVAPRDNVRTPHEKGGIRKGSRRRWGCTFAGKVASGGGDIVFARIAQHVAAAPD
ncbi:MAG: hypothetical protein J0H65_11080, partial [Rhizobiales bacterium]|nr:hypothetical protein [Hyphomicrobiales bacterium]